VSFLSVVLLLTPAPQNFLLACLFRNGGVAILLSALTALYQQTYAGFFVHLGDIPPVLRWLQWLAPLKYTLEVRKVVCSPSRTDRRFFVAGTQRE
jgi:hypothetical protein